MRIRSIATPIKPLGLVLLLVLTSVASTAREAKAERIAYVTDGVVGSPGNPSSLHFDRMENGFNTFSSFMLGRFEIDKPTSAATVTYDNIPFSINYFWSQLPGQPTNIDGTVVFHGHISGTVGLTPEQNALTAVFDSVNVIDGNKVYTADSNQMFKFPSPSAGMIFPAVLKLMTPSDAFSPNSSSYLSPWIMVQTVPEPAMAWLFVTGMGVVGVWRRCSRRVPGIGFPRP